MNSNPYIVGPPVDRPGMFFGRANVIERLKDHLDNRDQNGIYLLLGNTKAGKSYLLRHIAIPGVLPGWLVVTCCLQEGGWTGTPSTIATQQVFRLLTRQMGWRCSAAGIDGSLGNGTEPEAGDDRRRFVRQLNSAYGSGQPFDVFSA